MSDYEDFDDYNYHVDDDSVGNEEEAEGIEYDTYGGGMGDFAAPPVAGDGDDDESEEEEAGDGKSQRQVHVC